MGAARRACVSGQSYDRSGWLTCPQLPRQDPDRSHSSAGRRIGRRTLLAGAAATVLGAAACTDRSTNPLPRPDGPQRHHSDALADALGGDPVPSTGAGVNGQLFGAFPGWAASCPACGATWSAVRTFDPRRDNHRPLAVIRAADAGDITDSLSFAIDHGLGPVRVDTPTWRIPPVTVCCTSTALAWTRSATTPAAGR